MNNLLQVEQLTFGYNSAFFPSFDFALNACEVVALLGPNGTGKSTFMRVLAGELQPLQGSLTLLQKSLKKYSAVERAQKIARVRPTLTIPERITVQEYVSLGRSVFAGVFDGRRREDLEAVEKAMELADVKQFAKRTLNSLSDGERARVFLAEAFAKEPKVLLLDEPTAFLDVPHTIELFKLLKQVANERSCGILICTHQVEYAKHFADRLIVFNSLQKPFVGDVKSAEENGSLKWASI